MTAKEVVEAYSVALAKGNIPQHFHISTQQQNGINREITSFQEHKVVLKRLARCFLI